MDSDVLTIANGNAKNYKNINSSVESNINSKKSQKLSLESLPDEQVRVTKVCKKTLDPIWNEVAFL